MKDADNNEPCDRLEVGLNPLNPIPTIRSSIIYPGEPAGLTTWG